MVNDKLDQLLAGMCFLFPDGMAKLAPLPRESEISAINSIFAASYSDISTSRIDIAASTSSIETMRIDIPM